MQDRSLSFKIECEGGRIWCRHVDHIRRRLDVVPDRTYSFNFYRSSLPFSGQETTRPLHVYLLGGRDVVMLTVLIMFYTINNELIVIELL